VTAADDPPRVGRRDEEILRRFVQARDGGDVEGATRLWHDLVGESFDRVAGLVDVWSVRKTKLSEHEREEAIQRVLVSLWDKVRWTFRGTAMGELHNTIETLVGFRCADVVGEQVADRERYPTSLDRPWVDEDGDERGQHPADADESTERWYREAEQAEARELVDGLMAEMPDERERLVTLRTLEGAPAAEIAEEVGINVTHLYKVRERGIKTLRRLAKEQDA
jgi:RNA polymerase sigma factor (sigma-70 family)